jgi:hypothetical protein
MFCCKALRKILRFYLNIKHGVPFDITCARCIVTLEFVMDNLNEEYISLGK